LNSHNFRRGHEECAAHTPSGSDGESSSGEKDNFLY